MNDSLSRVLSDLPQADSDQARSERLRSRCHALLATQRSRVAARQALHLDPRRPASRRRLPAAWRWEPIVVGMGCVYFAGVIREALRVYGAW